jgi:hypothetical protein
MYALDKGFEAEPQFFYEEVFPNEKATVTDGSLFALVF